MDERIHPIDCSSDLASETGSGLTVRIQARSHSQGGVQDRQEAISNGTGQRLAQHGAEVAALRSVTRDWSPTLPVTSAGDDLAVVTSGPAMIGRYVILGRLGSGGQADVYRVIDPELARNLVLKLSHVHARDGEESRDALVSEGRLLADLDHPGLLRVFDVGIYDRRPYLVLEYVSGRNLEQQFSGRRPSPREAARLIADIARVVAYTHRHGVVHGDIKPQNVMIDDDGRARLIDFGLARFTDAWHDEGAASGGTPGFLPPELAGAVGHRSAVPQASDVFGLGATLYWLLTGRPPYRATTLLESLDRARCCDVDFGPLRQKGIPRRLAALCQQAMAADPCDRPRADQWATALDHASSPWPVRTAVAAGMVLLLAVGFMFFHRMGSAPAAMDPQPVLQSVPEIVVLQDDRLFDLSDPLPLHIGDRIAFASGRATDWPDGIRTHWRSPTFTAYRVLGTTKLKNGTGANPRNRKSHAACRQ